MSPTPHFIVFGRDEEVAADTQEIGRSAVRKSYWLLMPTIFLTGMLSYIDR